MAARGYEFYLLMLKVSLTSEQSSRQTQNDKAHDKHKNATASLTASSMRCSSLTN